MPCVFLCAAAFALGRHTGTGNATDHAAAQTALMEGTQKLWTPKILPIYKDEPLAKDIIRRFDLYLMNGATFDQGAAKLRNVGQWLAPEFIYETVGFPSSKGLAGWCLSGEESHFRTAFPTSAFSQMLFFGDETHATTTSYGDTYWKEDLFGIPPLKEWTYFRVLDFYLIRKTGPGTGLVHWNFMMIDFADLFRRVGRPVLPPAPLPEGLVLSAAANDGVPAPLSVMVAGRDSTQPRAAAEGALVDGWAGNDDSRWWHKNLTFYGPGGIGLARGSSEYEKHVLGPYRAAFTNRSCEAEMLFCEGNYCAAFGTLRGIHVGTWVGQPASYREVGIRFGMHWRIDGDRIQEGWAIFDFPGFLQQLGRDFFALARESPQLAQ